MRNFEMNKYYVYGMGCEGMDEKDLAVYEPNGIFDNLEDAMKEIEKLWDEILECDETSYIYHNGILKEIYPN